MTQWMRPVLLLCVFAGLPALVLAQRKDILVICTAPWAPMVNCTPNGDPTSYTGFDLEMVRRAASDMQFKEGRDFRFLVGNTVAWLACHDFACLMHRVQSLSWPQMATLGAFEPGVPAGQLAV
jgi:hypothetical protein